MRTHAHFKPRPNSLPGGDRSVLSRAAGRRSDGKGRPPVESPPPMCALCRPACPAPHSEGAFESAHTIYGGGRASGGRAAGGSGAAPRGPPAEPSPTRASEERAHPADTGAREGVMRMGGRGGRGRDGRQSKRGVAADATGNRGEGCPIRPAASESAEQYTPVSIGPPDVAGGRNRDMPGGRPPRPCG